MNYTEIGARIREAIKKKGFKQKFVAEKIGISEDSMVNYIKGRREISIDNVKKIAQLCDVPYEYLINGEPFHVKDAQAPYLPQSYLDSFTELFQRLAKEGHYKEIGLLGGVIANYQTLIEENERLQSELNKLKMQNPETQNEERHKERATSA
ncbi:MAG: hypothetical protein A2499_04885 [Stygiobacter sp. RIFOXYC12_FULL_38_8]|nr:MAG: hypothetical protein A2299_16255 [Stygiobacter sp. RIFOXYB2_FULL_37_11]OGV13460.1 MAG: hypothetical protein A2237_16950 [Stygiobacter sp. RIFOXYA2_FULL_38_8]OGV14751.1 MAG: hypothetical protein A2440_09635 [Stygiobacter sp. RIFOXYC2_FULL_38_25]OGV22287.1 MAG: hypothetical protein A2499_04885 [Stygiobacter sp. RIFOXYC12_FULL_38_8]OGV79244.1 MAG: hypothetical protein A2X65_02005 [Stygiobacter sp. GWF2_38_21]